MGILASKKVTNLIVAVLLVVVVGGAWYWQRFLRYATIHFLDVGQGDATLIHVPPNTQMLIDCGRDAQGLAALARTQPYFDRTIEYLVLTHADADHYAGCIDILTRYTVEQFVFTGLGKRDHALWNAFMSHVQQGGSEIVQLVDTHTWYLDHVTITSLFPDQNIVTHPLRFGSQVSQGNNASVVLRIDASHTSYLLMGDAEKQQEQYLVQQYGSALQSDVLKVGHHGSATSSTEEFLQHVGAGTGVISSGKENRYGHPAARVVARLKRHDIQVRRTDLEGDVQFMLY